MLRKFSLPEQGLEVEIGKVAKQADGAAWIKAGDNVVLSTVVASSAPKEFPGFFPLTVEYRERTSAAGRFPGGFFKREGKLSDIEVLTSRLIDRPIRPFFPSDYFNEVQVLSTVYSSDGKFPASILGLLGASIALTISRIPFLGPIGGVEACKINGSWKFNPTFEELQAADSDIVIVGTVDGICMVEGHCNNVPEAEILDLFFSAHELIKQQVVWQSEIAKELGVVKDKPSNAVDFTAWKNKIKDFLPKNFAQELFMKPIKGRRELAEGWIGSLLTNFSAEIAAKQVSASVISYLFDSLMKDSIPDLMLQRQSRLDGRKFDEVRPISSEVAVLPCVHGSAIFQRGETQALACITLGTGQDAQKIETLIGGAQERLFMLHYSMPPFASGEAKPMRGTSRRETGHGYLAETSFANVLPSQEKFPYTVRSSVDILSSNGSTSMAAVCSTALALMDAGVPIQDCVSGVAMGLVKGSDGSYEILTDILGDEDGFGLMDFKVTGTDKGIMAFQLDIKAKVGFTRDLFIKALEQARKGRLHILNEMRKTLIDPRKKLSDLAPRVMSIQIPQDKIGALIGPGGKNIKEIVAKTNTQIDIEDNGIVKIYSKSGTAAGEAESWIRTLVGEIASGTTFNGTIKRISEFGLFVELVPGKEGLVHISTIAREKQRDLDRLYKINDKLKVKVISHDKETGRIRLAAPDLEKP